MGPLVIAQFIVCGICLTIGLLHLALFARMSEHKTYLFFALMCSFCGAAAFLEALAYRAVSLQAYNSIYKWQVTSQGLLWISMVWFIASFTGTARRWTSFIVTTAYGLAVVINTLSPYGILYTKIESLHASVLPWGERITFATGPANPWRIVADAGWLLMIYLVIESCVRLGRKGLKRRAWFIGTSLLCCLGPAYVHGTLVDFAVLAPPFYISFAFLALILIMSAYLVGEVVRASTLTREVAANEQRWRSLLENVGLIVAGIDAEGRLNYVNPHFTAITGYSCAEAMGRPFIEFSPEHGHEERAAPYQKALRGELIPHHQSILRKKDGSHRQILWSNVILRDPNDKIAGTLSIGADVTDRLEAEKTRDHAIKELEDLKNQLEKENIYLKEEIQRHHGFEEIVGKSNALLYVLSRVQQVAETDATVLVQGETGVGKELISRAIHQASRRSEKPFVTVNCAALPPNLIESELFGHERGAFTGAQQMRKGRFELGDGGTIFLDEISELPLEIQAKMLRVLQDGDFERVGGSRTLSCDVRVIAATNRNLSEEVAAARFRADLFYRLNVFPITVPPLRDRREDIPLLVEFFVRQIAARVGKTVDQVEVQLMEQFTAYDWPGNVRELQNVLERAVITSPDNVLHVPPGLGTLASTSVEDTPPAELSTLETVERQHIVRALEATSWRISGPKGAANILGLNPSTLRFRMKKLRIRKHS